MSFRCHSWRPPRPGHKVWRKIVHPEVRLGEVTGVTPEWLFRPFVVILGPDDQRMGKWRSTDRDENPPIRAHFLRNDPGMTYIVISKSVRHSRIRMTGMTLTTFQLGEVHKTNYKISKSRYHFQPSSVLQLALEWKAAKTERWLKRNWKGIIHV